MPSISTLPAWPAELSAMNSRLLPASRRAGAAARSGAPERFDKQLAYTDRDFFQFSGGSSEPATRCKYALAYLCARSFPSSMLSTDSDGAIQVFPVTL